MNYQALAELLFPDVTEIPEQLEARFPQYHFAKHKGYGTKRHYELLRRYGPCPIHRRTFLKKL